MKGNERGSTSDSLHTPRRAPEVSPRPPGPSPRRARRSSPPGGEVLFVSIASGVPRPSQNPARMESATLACHLQKERAIANRLPEPETLAPSAEGCGRGSGGGGAS